MDTVCDFDSLCGTVRANKHDCGVAFADTIGPIRYFDTLNRSNCASKVFLMTPVRLVIKLSQISQAPQSRIEFPYEIDSSRGKAATIPKNSDSERAVSISILSCICSPKCEIVIPSMKTQRQSCLSPTPKTSSVHRKFSADG